MIFRPLRLWSRLREQLWFKPACWSVVATAIALAAALANQFIPPEALPDVEQETVQSLLTIIASSMLTVSTFSLSILVQAFSSAAGSATPRALRVIMADDSAQTAIATFLAAFIYAVIALMAMGLNYYGPSGRFVLLLFSIVVVVQVIVMLIRWIRTLSQLGRLGHTIEQVEGAAFDALTRYWRARALGGVAFAPGSFTAPDGAVPLQARLTGYVQHVDVQALQERVAQHGARLWLCVRPGAFVVRGQRLAMAHGADAWDDATQDALREAFEIGADRNFPQDPRFGLIVLGEIGQRALSPAVNDPGSAILVAAAITRVLVDSWWQAQEPPEREPLPICDRIFVPALDEADLLRDAFAPLQRDAGGMVEVHTRFIKSLEAIAEAMGGEMGEEARRLAWRSWRVAREQLVLEDDRANLERLARRVAGSTATD